MTAGSGKVPGEGGARSRSDSILRVMLPVVVLALGVVIWDQVVQLYAIPAYVLPGPRLVFATLLSDWPVLSGSLVVTLLTTVQAFLLAAVGGVGLAVLFNQSRLIEYSLYPYAVILQVTPIVAIAPLIIIWVENIQVALVLCATIVAIFPIISNTTLGLRSVNRGLADLFRMNGATRLQTLVRLRIPSAAPYFFGGLRISSGLALIGAVVAEFVAGTGGHGAGLAYQILQAGFQLNIPRLFAALFLITVAGVLLFLAMAWLSRLALGHWHESELAAES
jgi:NitT/TauT family transport system permease protein